MKLDGWGYEADGFLIGEIDELEKKLGDLTKGKDKPSPP
jgi:hypothetical protein